MEKHRVEEMQVIDRENCIYQFKLNKEFQFSIRQFEAMMDETEMLVESTSEEKVLGLSSEQQDRLSRLRKEHENDKEVFKDRLANIRTYGLEVNDPVRVTIKGVSFSGYIYSKNNSDFEGTFYEVSTPHGIIKCEWGQVRRRSTPGDYSGVEVPEALKKMSTKKLLKTLGFIRLSYDGTTYEGYTEDQVKAELSTREHVPSKRELKVIKELMKKS